MVLPMSQKQGAASFKTIAVEWTGERRRNQSSIAGRVSRRESMIQRTIGSGFCTLVLAIMIVASQGDSASAADREIVKYRMTSWKSVHFNDEAEAQKQHDTLKKIGCEVKKHAHGDHVDVSVSMPAMAVHFVEDSRRGSPVGEVAQDGRLRNLSCALSRGWRSLHTSRIFTRVIRIRRVDEGVKRGITMMRSLKHSVWIAMSVSVCLSGCGQAEVANTSEPIEICGIASELESGGRFGTSTR